MRFFTVLLVLCSISLNAQDYPKGTSSITIENGLTAEQNYRHIGQALLEKGYEIETNSDFYTIKTLPRREGRFNMYYYFTCMEGRARITGQYNIPGIPGWSEIENVGMKKSPAKLAFAALVEASTLISG